MLHHRSQLYTLLFFAFLVPEYMVAMEYKEENKLSNHRLRKGIVGLGIAVVGMVSYYGYTRWKKKKEFSNAIENNDFQKMSTLLENKDIDVNIKNSRDETGLIIATKYNEKDIVEKLLKNGADPNIKVEKFYGTIVPSILNSFETEYISRASPLHYALWFNNATIFKMLLENKADTNIKRGKCDQFSILSDATEYESYEAVRMLLEHGAKPYEGLFPKLTYFEWMNPDTKMKIFTYRNENPTHLHIGVIDTSDIPKKIAKEFENQANNKHELGLFKDDSLPIVERLIEYGATYNDARGNTTLHFALRWGCSADIIKKIFKNGANSNASGVDKLTPLHLALFYNSTPEIVKIILENGGDLSLKDKYYRTPLIFSENCNGNIEIIKVLINHEVDAPDKCNSVFHHLALHPLSFVKICDELMKIEKPWGIQDKKTILWLLMAQKRSDCIWSNIPKRLLLYIAGQFLGISNPQYQILFVNKEILTKKYNDGTTIAEMYLKCAETEDNEKHKQSFLYVARLLDPNK